MAWAAPVIPSLKLIASEDLIKGDTVDVSGQIFALEDGFACHVYRVHPDPKFYHLAELRSDVAKGETLGSAALFGADVPPPSPKTWKIILWDMMNLQLQRSAHYVRDSGRLPPKAVAVDDIRKGEVIGYVDYDQESEEFWSVDGQTPIRMQPWQPGPKRQAAIARRDYAAGEVFTHPVYDDSF